MKFGMIVTRNITESAYVVIDVDHPEDRQEAALNVARNSHCEWEVDDGSEGSPYLGDPEYYEEV